MTELKPCPFCGVTPELEDGGDRPWVIGCRNPDCLVLCDMDGADTKAETRKAWNTRPTPPTAPASVVEKVALAMANYDASLVNAPILERFSDFRFDHDRDEYLNRARAAIAAMQPRSGEAASEVRLQYRSACTCICHTRDDIMHAGPCCLPDPTPAEPASGAGEAIQRFIADVDDGDRAEAGNNPLMEVMKGPRYPQRVAPRSA